MRIKIDWLALALFIVLTLAGWLNIYAACYSDAHAQVFDFSMQQGKQIIWIGIAALVALVTAFLSPRIWSNLSYVIYGVGIVLLLIVLLLARTVNGGRSWIDLGPFKFQPSEFAKLATALAVAKYVGSLDFSIKKPKCWFIVGALIFVPAGLVLLQHDTGSALVFSAFLIPLFREGLSKRIPLLIALAVALFVLALVINKWLLLGIVLAIILGYLFIWLSRRSKKTYIKAAVFYACCCIFVMGVDFAYQHVLESHQRERIEVLLGKSTDLRGSGYNQNQAKIAIGSGGWKGKGPLHGTITKAHFVPEQETDFIFCTVGEEWGFIGCVLVVGLYVLMIVRLVTLAERQRSTYSRFYGYSVASILFIHFLVNVGMVLGIMPVIGIPLPFFSYGGSSLLAFTLLLFIFLRQDAERTQLI